jgi:hypothetical protein
LVGVVGVVGAISKESSGSSVWLDDRADFSFLPPDFYPTFAVAIKLQRRRKQVASSKNQTKKKKRK